LRHTIIWPATEGRDKGKHFLITEMSAAQGESWAYRAVLALMNSNAEMPKDFEKTGMAGLAQMGIRGLVGLPWFVAEPLLEEMMSCVQIIPDFPKYKIPRPLNPDAGQENHDIEEIKTRMELRLEIFKLHVDFSQAAVQSLMSKARSAAKKRSGTETESQP
jgi:hypothetical protein